MDTAFGRLLKRFRRDAHLTQEALATRAGYSSHYVSMLERGVRSPQPLTVDVLATALALDEPSRARLHDATATPRLASPGQSRISPPPGALIGREYDLQRLMQLLRSDDVRLLTLTGPGGVGKTSLARSAAAALQSSYADGAVFVDFSAASNPDDILPKIAQALTVREMNAQPLRDRLIETLRGREMLLLLDSFERVVDGAEMIGEMLTASARIRFLMTSRMPLRLRLEHEFRVQPLALPESEESANLSDLMRCPAVEFFVRQATLARPDFAISDANADVIASICRRLDGLPLAIELAAAQLSYLPLLALRDRLRHRLQVLTRGARDLPTRQQRMRDTIAWSYDLLPPHEQTLLRRLSVFAGSWTLDAAEDVCSFDGSDAVDPSVSILDGVGALVENSLVLASDAAAEEPRFRMLDTIQEYAAEQLAATYELERLRRRHALYYVRLAELAEPALQDWNQTTWYPRIERDQDNIRLALRWLLSTGEAESALRLAGAIWRFWHRHGDIREGRRWLEECLAAANFADVADTADVAGVVSKSVRAKALWGASWLAYHHGDYARGGELSREQLALVRETGDAVGIRNALTTMGISALAQARYDDGTRLLQEALDVCVSLRDSWHYATSLLNLGAATLVAADLARATALFEEAATLYQERGDEVFTARARQHLGYVRLLQGEYLSAGQVFARTLQTFADLGEIGGIADGLEAIAAVSAVTGNAGDAGIYMGAAEALRARNGLFPLPHIAMVWRPFVTQAENQFSITRWTDACSEGARMPLAEVVASAVSEQTGG